MGRNGKEAPVFSRMIKAINDNIGKVISSSEVLLGNEPGRNSVTAYLYKFIKLGYIEVADEVGKGVLNKETTYKVKKAFPANYNSVMLGKELKIYNGFIPDEHQFEDTLNKIRL